jgi:hypothetical protein
MDTTRMVEIVSLLAKPSSRLLLLFCTAGQSRQHASVLT